MADATSHMRREILGIPSAVETLLTRGSDAITTIAQEAAALDPAFGVTIARGSSDHVSAFLKYAFELELGLPLASIGPSVASIYGAKLTLPRAFGLSISQSGQSPDIVAMTRTARAGGCFTMAITNDANSPLAGAADRCINIHAGSEQSVAATKTFVTSAVAGLMLLAAWHRNDALQDALHALPEGLARAAALDWSEVGAALAPATSLFTLGRGPAWAISNEAALKVKETCQIHGESYSSAEVLHGPVSIVGSGFPVLCFASGDAAEPAVVEVADGLAESGARVFVTSPKAAQATALPVVRTGHRLTDPLALLVSFYAMVEQVARARGLDPDTPRNLRKVTETL